MNKIFQADFIWIPHSLGGYRGPPYEGMRTNIRWQKHIEDFLQCLRDVQWEEINFDPNILLGSATGKLINSVPAEWLKEGEYIEILNGYHVLAVGRITSRIR
ncbi:hypothetical protein [Beggiatoa leptomitoformis]|uniref:Uncharacterized protein n=1 Tax=Beggiatoa leptomitoformis TaxID=288004 RepID=A0A2N9YDQ4_9GAMM|nr:hypothetical protein [Beggiatoa leptomitoformis]ALG69014.1 hypothetical protein AL038_16615 [Beggiatoa leptomitoformis]AUI68586.1 hypothetical protein BLE401_07625 [Beggiatoa leptomitoformis]